MGRRDSSPSSGGRGGPHARIVAPLPQSPECRAHTAVEREHMLVGGGKVGGCKAASRVAGCSGWGGSAAQVQCMRWSSSKMQRFGYRERKFQLEIISFALFSTHVRAADPKKLTVARSRRNTAKEKACVGGVGLCRREVEEIPTKESVGVCRRVWSTTAAGDVSKSRGLVGGSSPR